MVAAGNDLLSEIEAAQWMDEWMDGGKDVKEREREGDG